MQYDITIIGAGIVGLATAYKILEQKPDIKLLILEKEPGVGMHQTGNNSGVIHSGIYYRPGSLRAINCINGYKQLLEFSDKEGIPYELCGKIIVANDQKEQAILKTVFDRGKKNGLDKIRMITPEEMKEKEPHVTGVEAIDVPYAGIIEFKIVANKLSEIVTDRQGGEILTNQKVLNIYTHSGYSEVVTDKEVFSTKLVINTAGLYSDEIGALTTPKLDLRIVPFRGEYKKLKTDKEYLCNNLIYPTPDPDFPWLGVHFTRMMKGGVEAGPNSVWAFKKEGYKISDISLRDMGKSLAFPGFQKAMLKFIGFGIGEYYRSMNKTAFTKGLQKLIPGIRKEDLIPGDAGVRALAVGRNGEIIDDFVFAENEWAINVLNAPSPAATACLSIGESVAEKALKRFN
ncbi:MAG: L-2-hydroxyglutarate oxidase [Bacteroidales bacterium]|nr:L-2-hydroxyglutarate oxidase [Bacteroidales bacterium]